MCRTGSGDGYEKYDFAVLPLTLSLALYLLKLIGIAGVFKATTSSFHRVIFFDNSVSYYDQWDQDSEDWDIDDDALEALNDAIDTYEWVDLPPDYNLHLEASRVDATTMGVDEESILFYFYPRDGNREFETQVLTKDTLTILASNLMELTTKTQVKAAVTQRREARVITLDREAATQ